MKKKRILRIITRLCVAGAPIHTILLNAKLDSQKYESYLLSGRIEPYESDMSYLADKYGIKPIYLNSMSRELSLLKDVRALIDIIKIINKVKPDIVHTHTAKAGMLGRIAAKLMGVKIIIHTFHGNVFKGYFSKPKTAFFIFLEKNLAKISSKIVAISNQQKQELLDLKITNENKIHIVPLGFDFENVIPSESDKGKFRKKYSIPKDAKLIGIIGRLAPIKNHKLFLDIAEALLKKYDNLFFLIIGDGELRKSLQEDINRRNLKNNVVITGVIKNLKPVYADLDLVLLTSNNEGTPVAIIEAMACRKVVMTTNVGGVEDFVENRVNGFYFPKGNSELFVKEIESWLMNDTNTDAMKNAASKKSFKQFSFIRLKNDIESMYKTLWENQ
ncbi:MAG: glycosyltransferase [Candidatus Cloacimonetes bacterium]|nr:glycosyltransferase [Candidatus Cloacimonadota bacterium]